MDFPSSGPHYQYDAPSEGFINADGVNAENMYASSYDANFQSYTFSDALDNVGSSNFARLPNLVATPAPTMSPAPVAQSTSSIRRPQGHVRRPRNAFMIFRSEFWAGEKIARTVEHDHRHISRIIAHYWNRMSEEEKQVWRDRAEEEKIEHLKKNPGYRFKPTTKSKKPLRRNVKRNGEDDMERCRLVADLLHSGKEGEGLTEAVKAIEMEQPTPAFQQEVSTSRAPPPVSSPSVFRSPTSLQQNYNHWSNPPQQRIHPLPGYALYAAHSPSLSPTPSHPLSSHTTPSAQSEPQEYPLPFFYPYTPTVEPQMSNVRSESQPSYSETVPQPLRHYAPSGDIYENPGGAIWANTPSYAFSEPPFEQMPTIQPGMRYAHALATLSPASINNSTSSSSASSSDLSGFSSFPDHVENETQSGPVVRRYFRTRFEDHPANELFVNNRESSHLAQEVNYGIDNGPGYPSQDASSSFFSASGLPRSDGNTGNVERR